MLNSKYNKSMLKLFLILLGLITITSAFGGGIKITENFWEELNNDQTGSNENINNTESEENVISKSKENTNNELSNNTSEVNTNIPNEPNKNKDIEVPIKTSKVIEPFQGSVFAGAAW